MGQLYFIAKVWGGDNALLSRHGLCRIYTLLLQIEFYREFALFWVLLSGLLSWHWGFYSDWRLTPLDWPDRGDHGWSFEQAAQGWSSCHSPPAQDPRNKHCPKYYKKYGSPALWIRCRSYWGQSWALGWFWWGATQQTALAPHHRQVEPQLSWVLAAAPFEGHFLHSHCRPLMPLAWEVLIKGILNWFVSRTMSMPFSGWYSCRRWGRRGVEGSRRVWWRREGHERDRPRFCFLARLVVRVARVEGYLAHLDKTF